MEENGEKKIVLGDDVEIRSTLIVRGKKILDGNHHFLRRKTGENCIFQGTLLRNEGEYFSLARVTVSGSGKCDGVKPDMGGRLVEVKSGLCELKEGTRLIENYNMVRKCKGGGGIWVHKGASVLACSGSEIADNMSPYGGGIYLEKGAVLIQNGGLIRNNVAFAVDGNYGGKGTDIGGQGRVVTEKDHITKILIQKQEKKVKNNKKEDKPKEKKKKVRATAAPHPTPAIVVSSAPSQEPKATSKTVLTYRLIPPKKEQVSSTVPPKKTPKVEESEVENMEVETSEVEAMDWERDSVEEPGSTASVEKNWVFHVTDYQKLCQKMEMWSEKSAMERLGKWMEEFKLLGGTE